MAATLETTAERSAKRMRYSDEEVARGLLEVAHCAGNVRLAADRLEDQGHPIPHSTLHDWKSRYHAERYQQIRSEVVPQTHARMATELEDAFFDTAQVKAETLAHFRTQIPDLKPADAASAVRNLGTDQGITATQIRVYRDKPTSITEHRTVGEDLQWLATQGVINSTAEDITDAEEVLDAQAISADSGQERA